jgi:hypothetical protein
MLNPGEEPRGELDWLSGMQIGQSMQQFPEYDRDFQTREIGAKAGSGPPNATRWFGLRWMSQASKN